MDSCQRFDDAGNATAKILWNSSMSLDDRCQRPYYLLSLLLLIGLKEWYQTPNAYPLVLVQALMQVGDVCTALVDPQHPPMQLCWKKREKVRTVGVTLILVANTIWGRIPRCSIAQAHDQLRISLYIRLVKDLAIGSAVDHKRYPCS